MKPRVLIIEDEPLIAVDLETVLTDAGYDVAGVAGSVERAIAMLKNAECEGAMLDSNLRGEKVDVIASTLRQRGIPFVFVSGYGRDALSGDYADVPLLRKPIDPVELVRTIRDVLASQVRTHADRFG